MTNEKFEMKNGESDFVLTFLPVHSFSNKRQTGMSVLPYLARSM